MNISPAAVARSAKSAILRQEAVARMHRLRAVAQRGLKDRVTAQIALARRRRARCDTASSAIATCSGVAVGIGIDGDRLEPKPSGRANDAAGNLAAIGDQDPFEQ